MGRGEPSQASLEVNLSLYDNVLRERLLRRTDEVATAVVVGAGGMLSTETDYALPAVVNDELVTAAVGRAAEPVLGATNIVKSWHNRFADDVALFLAAAPGCLLLLGTANPDKGVTEIWHHPGFDVDENALPAGVHVMSLAALDLLQ